MGAKSYFQITHLGLWTATVCTSLSAEDAVARLNAEAPTGIESKWVLTERRAHEQPCETFQDYRHFLFEC